jgi:2-(1,2-epoxy-1,2-dihydrophenyl)acetyl-CoA isomerase
MSDFVDLLYGVNDGTAWITLNRPEKLNALTWSSWAEIETAIDHADADDAVRCVVITGAGRGFCAGTDLTADPNQPQFPRPIEGRAALQRTRYLGPERVHRCRKPVIAAVNGVAVGAGLSLALAADIRIAAQSARFSAIFVKRGIGPDTGATWFLPRLVGSDQALAMLWTGKMVPADEAREIGLVTEVVSDDTLIERTTELAGAIAHGPSIAIEIAKRLVYDGATRDLVTQTEQEQFLQQATQGTEDAKEGRLSFIERREPRFTGR